MMWWPTNPEVGQTVGRTSVQAAGVVQIQYYNHGMGQEATNTGRLLAQADQTGSKNYQRELCEIKALCRL